MPLTLWEIRPLDSSTDSISAVQSGTWDIGTVTTVTTVSTLTSITNDVNIADGGNSITVDDGGGALTVDGTVAATQSGTWDIGTVTTLTGITNDVNIADGGNVISIDDAGSTISIDDGGGSITVDGSVTLSGGVADDAADSGNPLKVGSRAIDYTSALSAISTANDRADVISDLYRRLLVNDSYNVGWRADYVAVSTSAVQLDPAKQAGRKVVVVQNLGDKNIAVGDDNTVTYAAGAATDGLVVAKRTSWEFKLGEALNVYAIGETGASSEDIRVVQAA